MLLLLAHPSYGNGADDVDCTEDRIDALLSGYGFQRIAMPKDGDCLFSAVSFQLHDRFHSASDDDPPMLQHLASIGILPDLDLPEILKVLRELTVQEFLGVNKSEYTSYLVASDRKEFEDTAHRFADGGFFDCELGNAAPLALANIL